MSSLLGQLSLSEKNLLQEVHEAIKNGVQQDKLASIRERILLESTNLLALVQAFDTVLEVNKIERKDPEWNHLKKIADDFENGPVYDQEA
jgi:hypothetical protein